MADEDLVREARELAFSANDDDPIGLRGKGILRAMADEIERLREQWNTRFNVLCGLCGKRYLGPRDEHLHGYGACGQGGNQDVQ